MKPKRILCTGALSTAILSSVFAGPSAASPDGQLAELRESRAFAGADSEIQEAWLSIARLALQYQGIGEQEILELPGIVSAEERSGGRVLRAVASGSGGKETTFDFNRSDGHLAGARLLEADGTTVAVGFTRFTDPDRVGVLGGYVAHAGGVRRIEFVFGSALTRPQTLIDYLHGTGEGQMEGRIAGWDAEGSLLFDRAVPLSGDPFKDRDSMMEAMVKAQAETGAVSPKEMLYLSPAYKGAEFELKRKFDAMASWSARILDTRPDALAEELRGDETEQRTHPNSVDYLVKRNGNLIWTVTYDSSTGHLRQAVYDDGGGLTLYFDHRDKARLLGGRAAVRGIGKEDTYWLVNFYPGQFTPRMALAAAGSPTDGLLAHGALHVWDREGALLVDRSNQEPIAIEMALGEIESALTDTQRADIGWRGMAREAAALSGRE